MSSETTQSVQETDNQSLDPIVEDILKIPEPADNSYVKQVLKNRGIELKTLVPRSEYIDEDLEDHLIGEKYNEKASFGIIKRLEPHSGFDEKVNVIVQLPFGGVIESDWYRPGYPKSEWIPNVFKHSNANSISELPGTLIPVYPVTDSATYRRKIKNNNQPFRINLSEDKIKSEGWTPRIARTGNTSSSPESSSGILGIFGF